MVMLFSNVENCIVSMIVMGVSMVMLLNCLKLMKVGRMYMNDGRICESSSGLWVIKCRFLRNVVWVRLLWRW